MTTILNFITTHFIDSSPYGAWSDGIAVVGVAFLLTLLVEKVLLDAYEDKPIENRTQVFTIVTLPLLFVLAAAIFLKTAQILHLW